MVLANPTIIELNMGRLEDLLQRVDAQDLREDDYGMLRSVIESYVGLFFAVGDKNTTIARLRKMLFGARTEKTATVLGQHPAGSAQGPAPVALAAGDASTPQSGPPTDVTPTGDAKVKTDSETTKPDRAKGHGRNGADAYTGAEEIDVPHSSLQPGDPCPECETGTLYDSKRPGVMVRLVGQPPVGAKVYYRQKLRCNPCGAVFTAKLPAGAGDEKYDATVGTTIAMLRYGMGMPMNRNETLQESVGVPLPASTQWDIVADQAERAEPAFEEIVQQAAQADVIYHDDTTVKILALREQAAVAEEGTGEQVQRGGKTMAVEDAAEKTEVQRKGLFTTGIVAETRGGKKIALFLSGHQHAGENLKDLLARRAADTPPPIQMCDALSRNMPAGLKTILANCLAHGRRKFVDVAERFPEECRQVLELLAVVYRNDAIAKQRNLSPADRLLFHQADSGPVMEKLHAWLRRQFDQRLVEPNSALGGSITYMLRHWEALTLFLRVAGAPLDNNICERALKLAIRHRKNSLFYRTPRGARVGDIFMSLIHTCRLCKGNPFHYLTELERHAKDVAARPGEWMPWNYRQTLAAVTTAASAAP
jgi:transposase